MGFSHRARSSSDRLVCLWIRSSRSRSLLALSASGLIAGKNDVNFLPSLRRASRGRKAYPRKVNEVCSCSPRRLLVAVGTALRREGSGCPPRRSQRALLTHWAPPLGTGVEPGVGPLLCDAEKR